MILDEKIKKINIDIDTYDILQYQIQIHENDEIIGFQK